MYFFTLQILSQVSHCLINTILTIYAPRTWLSSNIHLSGALSTTSTEDSIKVQHPCSQDDNPLRTYDVITSMTPVQEVSLSYQVHV